MADPIVVVGAGPVGLTLALALVRAGEAVVVLEQRTRLPRDLRATTLQPPILEMLEDLGVLAAVEERSHPVLRIQYWDWDHHELLASLSLGLLANHTRHPRRLHCPQPDLCDVLFEAIESTEPGTVRLGTALSGLVDRGDHVELHVRTDGVDDTLRASWVCGADGLKSTVRRALGVPLETFAGPDVFLTCEAGLEASDALERAGGIRPGPSSYLFSKRGWALVMQMRDCVRFLFRAQGDGPEAMTHEALDAIEADLLGDAHVEWRNRALYTVRQQLVSQWVRGRVVVLGDAAHSTFPVAGTGMNSGLHDAFTLAAALPVGALGAWEQNRARALETRVNRGALLTYETIQAKGLFSRIQRGRHVRRLNADEKLATEHLLRACLLEDRAPAPPELR